MRPTPVDTRSLLIVEDEAMIAMLLEDEAARAGYRVLPLADTVADALHTIEIERPDVAILDMSIAGELVYPVADALGARGVPFVFISGREAAAPPRYSGAPCIIKPFAVDDVLQVLDRLLAATGR